MPFINDMIAYMKDFSHTVLIIGTPGIIDIETDKRMKINGAGAYYLSTITIPTKLVDTLECSHLVCYDTDIPVEGFEVSVQVVFSDPKLLKLGNTERHKPLFVIAAEDTVSQEVIADIVTTVPLKYREKQEQVTDENTTTTLVVNRERSPITDMSVLAISVKRMIRGLI